MSHLHIPNKVNYILNTSLLSSVMFNNVLVN